ncbi:MAG: hypothetical protein QHH09_01880 [Microgenomates group bacterium]|nr:hypothetical protein [Microgenomates group bacterium]
MSFKKFLPIAFFFISFFLLSFKLSQSVFFEGDLARDLYEIEKISFGDITLLGPKGSFGGIYTAPYYYYLFLPAFLLTGRSIKGVIFFNALLFSFIIAFLSYFFILKFKKPSSLLAPLSLMLFPFFIFSGRNPGNGFSHIPFFILFLSLVYFFDINKFNFLKILSLGLLFGFIISMQFSYFPLVIPILLFLFFIFKDKRSFFVFLCGVGLAFSPLFLFEIKNHFIMLKNTFVDRSYLSFVENKNLPHGVKLSKNPFSNLGFLFNQLSFYLNFNSILIILFIFFSIFFTKKTRLKLLNFFVIFSFFILVFLLRFQYSFHYLLPFLTFLSFSFLITLIELKIEKFILPVVLIFLIFNFSKSYYQKASRSYDKVGKRVEKILAKNWFKKDDKLNVLFLRSDDAPTPAGFEYRFFLLKNGYKTLDQFSYSISDKLLLISEKPDINLNKIKNWELSEFNPSKARSIKTYKIDGGVIIYFLEK